MKHLKNKQLPGFTLLETLIAVILLSFGLLGVAGMQVKSHQFNRSAYFETQAIIVAHDMLERMRANVTGQKAEYYNQPSAIKHGACYTKAGCSTLEMAQNDMYEWAGGDTDSIATKLPSGAGVVCIDGTPDDGTPSSPSCNNNGSIYAIKIWWQSSDETTRRAIITADFE